VDLEEGGTAFHEGEAYYRGRNAFCLNEGESEEKVDIRKESSRRNRPFRDTRGLGEMWAPPELWKEGSWPEAKRSTNEKEKVEESHGSTRTKEGVFTKRRRRENAQTGNPGEEQWGQLGGISKKDRRGLSRKRNQNGGAKSFPGKGVPGHISSFEREIKKVRKAMRGGETQDRR